MESPTIAVVGGNRGRGRGGGAPRCSAGRVGGVSGNSTVTDGDLFFSQRGKSPERLAARAASLTILRREAEVVDGGLGADPTTSGG